MRAKLFCHIVKTYTRATWPDAEGMESQTASMWGINPLFNVVGDGSHKYIPTEKLNDVLGFEQGEGIYGYLKFDDGSYCLLTCGSLGLAYWDGDDKATPLNVKLI